MGKCYFIVMRIALVLTPPTQTNFTLAAQVGAQDYVARYQRVMNPDALKREFDLAGSHGLRLAVVEGYLPMRKIICGAADRDDCIQEISQLIRAMGKHGVPVLCYNFMASDWSRSSLTAVTRGGALTSAFQAREMAFDRSSLAFPTEAELWKNLGYFLDKVLPVAEESGVVLAMHPSDPPVPQLGPGDQIMFSAGCFDRLFNLSDSEANAMCFCQGTFASMRANIVETIHHFASKIRYVHFRDVKGTAENFIETFHDDGDTDMAAAMKAYFDIGFAGSIRPDHVPLLATESGEASGYTMQGRLFAVGYMRGLIHALGPKLFK